MYSHYIPMSACVAAALGLLLSGCAGSDLPKTYTASGRAVYQGSGQPVENGVVELVSTTDPTLCAIGEIEEDGRFQLIAFKNGQEQAGAAEGEYKVFIELSGQGEDAGTSRVELPGTQTIKAGENELTIEVPAQRRR